MFFFGQQKLILYLKRNSLEIYKNNEKTADVTYPEGTFVHLEIVDPEAFGKFITGFLPSGRSLGSQPILVVLGNDLVFQKIIPRSDHEEADIQNFTEKIPFDLSSVDIKKIANDRELAILAITKKLYQPLKSILEKAGFSIEAIVPASIFGMVGENTPLNQKDIWQKVNDSRIVAGGNLLR